MRTGMSRKSTSTRATIKKALLTSVANSTATGPISIVEIAEASGINRATFYYHYKDLEELLDDIEGDFVQTMADGLKRAIVEGEPAFGPLIDEALVDLKRSEAFLSNFAHRMSDMLLGEVRVNITKRVAELLRPYYKEGPDSGLQIEMVIGGYLARLFADYYRGRIPSEEKVRQELRLLLSAVRLFVKAA